MKKSLLWMVVLLLSIAMVAEFSLAGCKAKAAAEEEAAETTAAVTTVEETTAEEALSEEEMLRKETLYVNGQIWGPPQSLNPLASNVSYPCRPGENAIYEFLFMYNVLTGKPEPLLATGSERVDENTLEVTINENAMFSDGEALTAEDVVYTYELGNKYDLGWSKYLKYLDSVTAESDYTVIFKLNEDNYNRMMVEDSLMDIAILPKHIWEVIEADNDNDITKIQAVFNEDPIGSGPYKMFFYDETKVTIVRDDNYWGQTLFGKLPAPKYITHTIFASNDAGNIAFKAGEVDMSQQFIPQVWKMWEDGTPIRTYLKDLPYYIPGSIPNIIFNMEKDGLDVPEVRKAIAMAIDYAKVSEVAMSGYSDIVVPGIAMPVESELKYIDKAATAPYEYTTDVDAANALLDSIDAEPGADGIRVLPDGTRLGPWEIMTPYGWTDWNATCEIISENAKSIGIEIVTNFPEESVYYHDANVGDFDIIMRWSSGSFATSQPYTRVKEWMYSVGVAPIGEVAYYNLGRYSNPRVDEIIELIPTVTDESELKALYTELDIIYLQDLPLIMVMYRPGQFYTVNESVWTGFPEEGDGTDIPPMFCLTGAGIRMLYNIENVEK